MSRRDIGSGWKGLLKAIGWSVAFGVEGLVIGLAAAVGIGALVTGEVNPDWFVAPGLAQAMAQGAGLIVGFGIATYHIGHRVLGRSWKELRWQAQATRGGWFGRGMAVGLAAAALAMALGLPAAGASWTLGDGSMLDWLRSAGLTAAALSLPALSEEVIFRGVPLVLLAGVLGRWPAVVATSLLFGLSHLGNPDVTVLGLANISLAGMLLGAVFFSPGGIWAAWGAHLGWNLSLAALGAPVSGLPLAIPVLEYHPGGPAWVSGGAFGPEGGILASVAMIGAIILVSRWTPKGEGEA
ncbi:MAG TPA: CPBP family intramembrane metalloprotease [Gemmatimonadales bacterium]|nr:CPBP family intramembrane metalloprotease [Gemmatimonadales bacterium]